MTTGKVNALDTDFAAGFSGAAPVTEAVEVIIELATRTDARTGVVLEADGPLPW